MTLFLEIDGPFQFKPFVFYSDVMVRIGWLYFAVGYLRVPFKKFATTSYFWLG